MSNPQWLQHARPWFDRRLSDDDLAAIQAEANERARRNWDRDELNELEAKRGPPRAQLNAREYQTYIASDEWKRKRLLVLEEADYRCERCNKRAWRLNRLEVHHRTYERLGCEERSDLMVLCQDCHMMEHFHAGTGQFKPRPSS